MKSWNGFLIAGALLASTVFAQAQVSDYQRLNNTKKIVLTEDVAREAYVWGYPLVKFSRIKNVMTKEPGYGHAPENTFFHAERGFNAKDREFTNPVPDTLYSSAFLNLTAGPVVIEVPKIKNRFYSLQLMDAFTNNIDYISSRTRGESGGKFFITGPRYVGVTPEGFVRIESPTNFVSVTGQLAIGDPSETRQAVRLLKKYRLETYPVYTRQERAPKNITLTAKNLPDPRQIPTSGIFFYDELGTALRENTPANLNAPMMQRFAQVDIGPGLMTSQLIDIPAMRSAYARAVAAGEITIDRRVSAGLAAGRNNWNSMKRQDSYGTDYPLRAAVARVYFGEFAPAEVSRPVTFLDMNLQRLNGNNRYILRFSKNAFPPTHMGWSLSVYNARDRSLVANNLNRYSLGSSSKKVKYNQDGSLDIYMSADEPKGFIDNWLPTPRGNFYVMVNMYNPRNEALNGAYILPGIQKVSIGPQLSLNDKK